MAQVKPLGKQLNIISIAGDIAADATAIGSIATGVLADPGATASFDAEFARLDGTNTFSANLNMGNFDITNVVNVAGRNVATDGSNQDTHIADATLHRVINDAGTSLTEMWSASKLTTDFVAKADKVGGATVGNFAALDAAGNLTDSGSTVATFAAASHNHIASDVTDFAAAVVTTLNANSVGQMSDIDVTTAAPITGNALMFTGSSVWAPRMLIESDISDLGTYEIAFAKLTAFNKDFGTTGTEVCVGNDARLSDARTPVAHTHVEADITDLQAYILDVTGDSIAALSDVFTTMTPVDGQVLTFDTTNGWQSEALPAAPVTSVAGKTGIVTLVEVDITDLDKYTQTAADALLLAKADVATPTFTGTVGFPTYTIGTLPAQAAGHQIYVSDATGSSLTGSVCFSNGTVWIDVTTGAAVA